MIRESIRLTRKMGRVATATPGRSKEWFDHSVRAGAELSDFFRDVYLPGLVMAKPSKVIRVLKEAGVHFVLMGTHSSVGYRREVRATLDVDVLVRVRDHSKAVASVRRAYPKLQVEDTAGVTRFLEPTTGEASIDLMKPYAPYLKLVFRNAVQVGESHLIPNLEMSLVAKYAAMTSPNRSARKKHTDAGDFMVMVERNVDALDMKKLKRLAEHVHPRAAAEIEQYVLDTIAGRTLEI